MKFPRPTQPTSVVLSRSELLEKLVALVPPPNMHMTRYIGVLSSAHCWRSLIVLKPNIKKGFIAPPDGVGDPIRLSWSMLLKKTFKIDITRCALCGGRIKALACKAITVPEIISSLLRAMNLNHHPPPITPARYIRREFDFDQRCECDVDQRCPDEVDQRCEYEFDQRVAEDDL